MNCPDPAILHERAYFAHMRLMDQIDQRDAAIESEIRRLSSPDGWGDLIEATGNGGEDIAMAAIAFVCATNPEGRSIAQDRLRQIVDATISAQADATVAERIRIHQGARNAYPYHRRDLRGDLLSARPAPAGHAAGRATGEGQGVSPHRSMALRLAAALAVAACAVAGICVTAAAVDRISPPTPVIYYK